MSGAIVYMKMVGPLNLIMIGVMMYGVSDMHIVAGALIATGIVTTVVFIREVSAVIKLADEMSGAP